MHFAVFSGICSETEVSEQLYYKKPAQIATLTGNRNSPRKTSLQRCFMRLPGLACGGFWCNGYESKTALM
jgi:hypothetical protein